MLEHTRAVDYLNINAANPLEPSLRFRWSTTPDLAAHRWVIVNYTDTEATLRRTPRGREPSRPGTHHQQITHMTSHPGIPAHKAHKNKKHIDLFVPFVCFLLMCLCGPYSVRTSIPFLQTV